MCLITGAARFSRWVTKNAPTVATTSSANTTVSTVPLEKRSAVRIAHRREGAVRDGEVAQLLRSPSCEHAAYRASVADHEGGQRAARDVRERRLDALGMLLERLPTGEAERRIDRQRAGPCVWIL